jgi:UDP-GlcNAc3NAcA epimerase
MLKIITVVGARPQFIKASVISRAIKNSYADRIEEKIIHTGQHYDDNMSEVFFQELSIPVPEYKLNVGSGEHGVQTAKMLGGIEKILLEEKPDYVLVYGDTNSTLAGAMAASKQGFPVVHIEAGLRSFNKNMPEEINRILCDHVSTLMFTPTQKGLDNLHRESISNKTKPPYSIDNPAVYHCGDIMYDSALYFSKISKRKSTILKDLKIENSRYLLVTLHRNINTDNPDNLNGIFSAFNKISKEYNYRIIIPIHPRTQKKLKDIQNDDLKRQIVANKLITFSPAVSYTDMISLEKNADMIVTDSGGVQKEAYFFCKKCLIVREETEWTELVENGMAELCGADENRIMSKFKKLVEKTGLTYPPIYGDGNAADFILKKILENSQY